MKLVSAIIGVAIIVFVVLAIMDIVKKPISTTGKIIFSILVAVTSWIGVAVYYLYAKDHLTEWDIFK